MGRAGRYVNRPRAGVEWVKVKAGFMVRGGVGYIIKAGFMVRACAAYQI